MMMVLAMAAALWGIGAVMKAPHTARWTMIGLLFVAVLALQVALPAGHPLREATGGDARLWLLLAGFGGLIWAYREFVWKRLKARAAVVTAARDVGRWDRRCFARP